MIDSNSSSSSSSSISSSNSSSSSNAANEVRQVRTFRQQRTFYGDSQPSQVRQNRRRIQVRRPRQLPIQSPISQHEPMVFNDDAAVLDDDYIERNDMKRLNILYEETLAYSDRV